jgi:HAD ATPase, P-type, family IC
LDIHYLCYEQIALKNNAYLLYINNFKIIQNTMKQIIPVIGMACAGCAINIERKLNSLEGVTSVSVSLPSRTVLVDFDSERISLVDMKREINNIGYDLIVERNESIQEIEKQEYTSLKRKTILAWLTSALLMVITMGWISIGPVNSTNQISILIAAVTMIYCGGRFYVGAYKQLCNRTANMDTLVALSTGIAFLFSVFNTFLGNTIWTPRGIGWHTYFDTVVMIIAFVLTGRIIEEKARDRMASSIRQLMQLAPKTAHVINGETIVEVPIAAVKVGDLLEVRPGEKVPADGEVISAESFMTADAAYVDESMITGEPTPVEKKANSQVLAGTIPSQGTFRMRAIKIDQDTALASIVRMVQQAQSSKAPVQRIVDKAALVFVPTVAVIALITFLVWWLIGGTSSLPQAIVSAVAVLVIACPCAMGLATPTALMVGIGKAAQKQILIKDAAALERLHKINVLVTDKTGTLTIPNQNIDFTKAQNIPLDEREQLKPSAREAINKLRSQGIDVYMMSGDNEESARYWASKTGIEHYHSKVLAQDKEDMVRQLQSEGKIVAMMGDGINDTQALALADVSIAMGKGTDVALDVAGITLMGDNLQTLPEAVKLSRLTVRMIWQNLFWAFIYNLICIPLAAGVLKIFDIHWQITPSVASALMAFSSVSVVLNSLRLRYL